MLLVNGFTYFKVFKRHNRPKGTDRHNYTVWHTKMGVKESVKREVEIIEKRNTLLKLFKGGNKYMQFSIDDSATHPNFESHLLSVGKDMKFPIVLPIF